MKIKLITSLAILIAFAHSLKAQKVTNSTNHVISSKAMKGGLYDVKKKGNDLQITYLLKKKKGGDKTEVYNFDYSNLGFKSNEEVIQDITTVKTFKKTNKANKVLRVFPGLGNGQIKLQLGYISYSVGTGVTGKSYVISKFIKETVVKPKGDDGDRLVYVMHHTLESDEHKMRFAGNDHNLNIGDAFVLGVENSGPLYTKYESIVYNAKDLSTKERTKINLPYSSRFLSGKILSNGNVAMLFTLFTEKDVYNPAVSKKVMAMYKFAPKFGFWYLELNPMGKVVHSSQIDGPEPESAWFHAASIVEVEEGGILITGSVRGYKLKAGPMKKINGMQVPFRNGPVSINQNKADLFYSVYVKEGKQVFYKETPWSGIIKNPVSTNQSSHLVPTEMKGYLKYNWFAPVAANLINGKILLSIQKDNKSTQLMQLDSKTGNIEYNYFLGPDKKKVISGAKGKRYLVNSKGELFVITYQQKSEKDPSSEKQERALFTTTAFIQKVDIKNHTLGDPVNICGGGNLDPYDGFWFEDKDHFITLSAGKKKEIIIQRIALD